MSQTYFFKKGTMQLGPYNLEKMRALARQGQVGRSYQISSDNGASWDSGAAFPEIFAADEPAGTSKATGASRSPSARHAPAEQEWYYCASGAEQQGPVPEAKLKELIELGAVEAGDTVWTEALGDKWVAVGSIPKFAKLFDIPSQRVAPLPQAIQPALSSASGNPGVSAGPEAVFCRECGARINRRAVVCPQCGVPSGGEPRDRVVASSHGSGDRGGTKSRMAAALLAFFVGGFGVHHFYLGNTTLGVIYLLTCWTLIPAIVAFVETIIFLTMSDKAFDAKYNS